MPVIRNPDSTKNRSTPHQPAAATRNQAFWRNVAGALIRDRGLAKGDVLEVARLAGIMAAKRTSDLIPLCHPLGLTAVALDFSFPEDGCLGIEATVRIKGRTGVEMEALTAVSVAALT